MRIFGKKSEATIDREILLALDIGTTYVKALIARKGDPIEIMGVGLATQAETNMHAGAIADIPGVARVCEEALSKAELMAGVRAGEVVVGIAGELIKGNTTTVRVRRGDPKRLISDEEMDKIVKKVQARSEEKARKALAVETDNPDIEVSLINSALVSLYIDGHKVANPVGFKGRDVAVQIYTAFAPLVHISAIEKVCDELQLELVAVAVEPFAVCRAVLGDAVESDFSGIVMDIGGGTTDIAVVDEGGVEGTKMFSIGGRSFTHQIAEKLGMPYEDAERLKLMADNPKMKPEVRDKMTEAVERNLAVWLSGVQLALGEFVFDEALPGQIFLCGGGASLQQIPEALALGDWYQELAFARRPVIYMIDPNDLPGIANGTEFVLDHTFVTGLGLLRVGMDTLGATAAATGVRARFARLLRN